ncbi:MAG: hypothetical protein ACK4WH_03275 [Phycisphaerales bacterium]
MRVLKLGVLTLAMVFCTTAAPSSAPALRALPPEDQHRYTIERDDHGVWWFKDPRGRRFYSLGVNNVTPEPFRPRPGTSYYNPVPGEFKGDPKAWGSATADLLAAHGFNTLGAWSSTEVPTGDRLFTTPVLYVVGHEHERCLSPLQAGFEDFVRSNVREAITRLPDRYSILGVFLDNEMAWFGKSGWDDIPNYTLLEVALDLPATDERRQKAVAFLKDRHKTTAALSEAYRRPIPDWDALNANTLRAAVSPAAMADRAEFTAMLAERFFAVSTRTVRAELPGVLILGTRFPGSAPDSVVRSCGRYCDVVSVNEYRFEPKIDAHNLARFHLLSGRPLMHTEFSWRAADNSSGCPNTRGAGAVVATQSERAAAYAAFVADIATVPYVIASHWFEFADQSPQGRFDGEDSNYGIVDIHNKPYAELLAAMKATNARVHDLHEATRRQMPSTLSPAAGVTYSPGQHPGRPSTLDLLAPWTREPEIWGAPDSHLSWKRLSTDTDRGPILLTFDTGAQYGAGINIFGPVTSRLGHGPDFATDLDGYSTIVLEASAPAGLQINIVLAEAGAAPSTAPSFDTSAGDDGEGYVSLPITAEQGRHTYRVKIEDLARQRFFGNQSGSMRIDMHAVRNLGLQVSGTPRRGELAVHSFRLER